MVGRIVYNYKIYKTGFFGFSAVLRVERYSKIEIILKIKLVVCVLSIGLCVIILMCCVYFHSCSYSSCCVAVKNYPNL
jgi:hypothetical protein